MSDNFSGSQEMAQALDESLNVNLGDVVKAEILQVDDNQLVVSILGTGLEGVVPERELSTQRVDDINDSFKVGDDLDLVVISKFGADKENGNFLLSRKRIEARKQWSALEERLKNEDTLIAHVVKAVKGGLLADVGGVVGFIPSSRIESYFVKNLKQYIGKDLKVKVIEIEPSENRLILSRRDFVQEEKKEKFLELANRLHEGDEVTGKITRITPFGAFVDVDGIDCLVHISEISRKRVTDPNDVLTVGEEVTAKVIKVDVDRQRVSLSLKALEKTAWDSVDEKVKIGDTLEGKVKRLTSFGAFVEVLPEIEGLVHISQISHKHIATPNEVLKVGEDVKVKVIDLEKENQRLSLSIKALEDTPKANDKRPAKSNNASNDNMKYKPTETSGFSIGDIIESKQSKS
ncbi:30S ribosomal protein S1 [Xylocopilactobacillus apicola]|uniref:30S ribosomal protein S1 n=1 Tax=Xylocopilactobacillus apicola TaxID=2932184 RepID=A0AAU9DAU6_9LACO|nr:30S ribosomal protein S1 [Xylocopilactobacillus apicola]BDR58660.1 30S ribosomal protein S1 [Xylocopilactobacillus apicola]